VSVDLIFGGTELVNRLEPLWLSLFDHHASTGAAELPVISRDQSWPHRRRLYHELLAHADAFVLLAQRDEQPVGYVVAHVHEGADDTWPTGNRVGEIETLTVLPTERGQGLGTRLLDAAEQRLASVGARDVMLSVLVGNDDALRFYRRRDMVPVLTTMLRIQPSSTPQ